LNPHKETHTLIANLDSCNVFESNNIGEQINFLHAPNLQSSSLEVFVVDPNAIFATIVIDVDDECAPLPKIPQKVIANVNHKFLEI
jgi:hypothetical protein